MSAAQELHDMVLRSQGTQKPSKPEIVTTEVPRPLHDTDVELDMATCLVHILDQVFAGVASDEERARVTHWLAERYRIEDAGMIYN